MDTHLYSKTKCLLFFCTICQRTFVCLFYYCLYIVFYLLNTLVSVKCFLSLTKRAKSFLYVKKISVFHILGNREIQTNVDKQLLDKLIHSKWETSTCVTQICLSKHKFPFFLTCQIQKFTSSYCFLFRCRSMNVMPKYIMSIYIFQIQIFHILLFLGCKPFGFLTVSHQKLSFNVTGSVKRQKPTFPVKYFDQ